jgi:hypothetical protein
MSTTSSSSTTPAALVGTGPEAAPTALGQGCGTCLLQQHKQQPQGQCQQPQKQRMPAPAQRGYSLVSLASVRVGVAAQRLTLAAHTSATTDSKPNSSRALIRNTCSTTAVVGAAGGTCLPKAGRSGQGLSSSHGSLRAV